MEIYYLIGLPGLINDFLSGLLGIGGGIVMAPLLLYIPPLFRLELLTMQTVVDLTIVQSRFVSSRSESRTSLTCPTYPK